MGAYEEEMRKHIGSEINRFACACRSSNARECIGIRYGGNEHDEECECSCHDEREIDLNGEDWIDRAVI